MMMGVGNLTELTDVDSAGVNTLLVGFCQELAIRSVLTTAVINWARSSVREIDLARRLVASCRHRTDPAQAPRARPGHAPRPQGRPLRPREPRRAAAADPRPELADLRRGRTDPCAEQRPLPQRSPTRSCSSTGWASPTRRMRSTSATRLMKAKTALTLSKTYRQDQALDWGFLTEPEVSHSRREQQAADQHSQDRARDHRNRAGRRRSRRTRSRDRA